MAPQPETANPAAPQEAAKAPSSPAPPAPVRSAPDGTITRPKLGAISPPLPWPSPKIQEIARPARPRFSALPAEVKSPSISEPLRTQLPPAAPAAGDNPGESASRPAFLARLGTERDRAARVLRRSRRQASRALLRTQAAIGKLSARIENARQLSKLRRQIQDLERMAAEHAGATQVDEALPAETQPSRGARAREQAFSLFASIRSTARRAIDSSRSTWGRTLATTRNRMNNAGDAARGLRLRIKFQPFRDTALPSWLGPGARAKLLRVRRDSRLWTSMAMAALSAVLALLVVSGVRGYAPEASLAKVSRNLPSTPVAPAAAMVSKPSPATRPVSSKPTRSAVKRASLSTPARSASSPKVTRKKAHHHEEDDYVAKDTYVYYGPNGRTTR